MTVKTSRNSANLLSMPTDLPPAQWTPFKPELKQLNHLRPEVRRRIAAVQVTTTNPV